MALDMPPLEAPSTRRADSHREVGPVVLAGLARDPGDEDLLDAATALSRALDGALHTLHVEPDPDGATYADVALRRASDDLAARVVVIGTRAPSGPCVAGRGRSGTTTRGLLAEPHVPLWVQRGPWAPPDRIVAAIDVPDRDREVLARAAELAACFHADLVALHCEELGRGICGGKDAEAFERWVGRELARAARRPEAEVQVVHLAGPPVRALAGHLERADLTVLGRGQRPGLGRVLHQTVAARRGPLVVVPAS